MSRTDAFFLAKKPTKLSQPFSRRISKQSGPVNAHVQRLNALQAMANKRTGFAPISTAPLQAKVKVTDIDEPNEYDSGTSSEEITELAEFLNEEFGLDFEDAGVTLDNIVNVLTDLAKNGDHNLSTSDIRDRVLSHVGHESKPLNTSIEAASPSDAVTGRGQRIGSRFFKDDEYHLVVKPRIKSAIGLRTLQKLVKKKEATNFDFWFASDGEIYVGDNGTGGKERATGFRLTEDYTVVEK